MDREFQIHIRPDVLKLYVSLIQAKESEWDAKVEIVGDECHQNSEFCRKVLRMREATYASHLSFTQRQLEILGLC